MRSRSNTSDLLSDLSAAWRLLLSRDYIQLHFICVSKYVLPSIIVVRRKAGVTKKSSVLYYTPSHKAGHQKLTFKHPLLQWRRQSSLKAESRQNLHTSGGSKAHTGRDSRRMTKGRIQFWNTPLFDVEAVCGRSPWRRTCELCLPPWFMGSSKLWDKNIENGI